MFKSDRIKEEDKENVNLFLHSIQKKNVNLLYLVSGESSDSIQCHAGKDGAMSKKCGNIKSCCFDWWNW